MNYIYDILINFKHSLYDFFDWNINDNILHIRKIPVLKISTFDLSIIKSNIIKVDNEFLKNIMNKTEVFNEKNVNNILYACLFCDENEAIGVKFNNKGYIQLKSRLLIDEELEVVEYGNNSSISNFEYKIIKTDHYDSYKTRKEQEIEKYITKEINSLLKNKQNDKLKYLYFELFNQQLFDEQLIIDKINNELKYNWDNIYQKIYNFFKLTSINK